MDDEALRKAAAKPAPRRAGHRLITWLASAAALLVLLLLGLAQGLLFGNAAVPSASSYRVDVARLRRLARSLPGALPARVNTSIVARSTIPQWAAVAGWHFGDHVMARSAFQIVYPERTIVLDPGPTPALHAASPGAGPFDAAAYAAVQAAIRRAELILITHEHPDHVGGLGPLAHESGAIERVRLTTEQAANRRELTERAKIPAAALTRIPTLSYATEHAVAPGLVLSKAPGHTPGSQLVYLLTEGGAEYLFVGDIAWHMDNITQLTGRPWLISRVVVKEERDAVLGQLRALHEVSASTNIHLVVSHDADQLARYVRDGVLGAKFE